MDIYGAIMAAAEHIERHPELHAYTMPCVPNDPVTPGCPLAWIGYFEPTIGAFTAERVAKRLLGVSESEFFLRMDGLQRWPSFEGKWKRNSEVAVRCLRLYAAKYHAPAQRTDSELVADLMARIGKQTIPDGEIASPEYVRA